MTEKYKANFATGSHGSRLGWGLRPSFSPSKNILRFLTKNVIFTYITVSNLLKNDNKIYQTRITRRWDHSAVATQNLHYVATQSICGRPSAPTWTRSTTRCGASCSSIYTRLVSIIWTNLTSVTVDPVKIFLTS